MAEGNKKQKNPVPTTPTEALLYTPLVSLISSQSVAEELSIPRIEPISTDFVPGFLSETDRTLAHRLQALKVGGNLSANSVAVCGEISKVISQQDINFLSFPGAMSEEQKADQPDNTSENSIPGLSNIGAEIFGMTRGKMKPYSTNRRSSSSMNISNRPASAISSSVPEVLSRPSAAPVVPAVGISPSSSQRQRWPTTQLFETTIPAIIKTKPDHISFVQKPLSKTWKTQHHEQGQMEEVIRSRGEIKDLGKVINDSKAGARKEEKPSEKKKRLEEKYSELLDSIFVQDDAVEGSEILSKEVWFTSSQYQDEPSLPNSILTQIRFCVRSFMRYGMNIPHADRVLRLYKILERSLRNKYNLSTLDRLIESQNAGDISQTFSVIDNSFAAIITILEFFIASDEAQLTPEDLFLSVIAYITTICEDLFIPLTGRSASELGMVAKYKTEIKGLYSDLIRITSLLKGFIDENETSETAMTKIEYIASRQIFVERTNKDTDSIFEAGDVERLKLESIEILCLIFKSRVDQRDDIIDTILSNLDRLPTKKSSRQFRISNGGNIQLITVLILCLLQCCSVNDFIFTSSERIENDQEKLNEVILGFKEKCSNAAKESRTRCSVIVQHFVNKASSTPKTGDSPHRLLLEMLVEDCLQLLFLPEWPSSELLISILVTYLMQIVREDKISVNAFVLSLELLGKIGMSFLVFKKKEIEFIDVNQNITLQSLEKLIKSINPVMEKIDGQKAEYDSFAHYAYAYLFTLYGSIIFNLPTNDAIKLATLAEEKRLLRIGFENRWPRNGSDDNVGVGQMYFNFLLSRPCSHYYDSILSSVLLILDHPKIQIRTRALKVVSQFLDQNSAIFSFKKVQASLSERIVDPAISVREVAVDIVGKYVLQNPNSENAYYKIVCERSADSGVSVRKKVLKVLQELYPLTKSVLVKAGAVEILMQRIQDVEETIQALAMAILKGIFFAPFLQIYGKSASLTSLELKQKSKTTASGLVDVLRKVWYKGDRQAKLLNLFFTKISRPDRSQNSDVKLAAKIVVDVLVDTVTETDSATVVDECLGILSVIVSSDGTLISEDQLQLLVKFLVEEKSESRFTCRYAMVVFRYGLNEASSHSTKFLQDLQKLLSARINKAPLRELVEVVPCFWTVSRMLNDTSRPAIFAATCLKHLQNLAESHNSTDEQRVVRFLNLLGSLVRFCDFDQHTARFTPYQVGSKKEKSAASIIVLQMLIWAEPSYSMSVRKAAIQNMGNACIKHPRLFLSSKVLSLFDGVMASEHDELRETIMNIIIEYFDEEENTANLTAIIKKDEKAGDVQISVLHGESTANGNDGVSPALAQQYLEVVKNVALSSLSSFSYTATRLLSKIMNQGYAHPKSCIPTIIALESSTKEEFVLAARQVHAKIHEKHESIIEGSYIDGIRLAAEYVKRITEKEIVEVSGDLGYLYDMIKSTRPSRRKLINNLLRSLEFDINLSLDGLVAHLNYVTFLSLSLAGVDFQSTEDVHFIVYGLDMFLSQTGTSLANKVEELLGSGEENVNVWAHVGIASTVVSVLLQLRQYCRAAYNLSDQKCRDFNPRSSNAKEFKTATKSEFATLDLKFDLPANLKVDIEASKNLAGLISQLVTSEPLSTTELHEPSEEPDSPKRKNIETIDQNPKLKQLKFE